MIFLLLFLLLWTPIIACASGSAPTIDAGGDKEQAFPAKDMTLFGHASDPEGDRLTFAWSQVSGPSGVGFSASWGMQTTVTFNQTGTYVFRLTVYDGSNTVTDDMTATVLSAASQTTYYVDPTYTGGSNDGSAAHPWTALWGISGTGTEWNTINGALASNHVVVYFSARTVGSDTSETASSGIEVYRTDTSTHRLTLDGMSKYNTNDSSGSWVDYIGANKFHVANTSYEICIGRQAAYDGNGNYPYPLNYVTLRGFECSGNKGRIVGAGNEWTVEYMYLHGFSGGGPGILQAGSAETQSTGTGTVSVSSGGTTVTGSGTSFLTGSTINVGGVIAISGTVRTVASITSNTVLDTTATWPSTLSGQSYTQCRKEFGNLAGMTYRHNFLEDIMGEGIYLGGNYNIIASGACPIWGNDSHKDVLVEYNTIDQASSNGEQPDGIDMKTALKQVTIRGNVIKNITEGTSVGLTCIGTFDSATVDSQHLIEQNLFLNARGTTLTDENGTIFRNNVFTASQGLYYPGKLLQGNFNITVENNTFYGTFLAFIDVDGIYARNNLFAYDGVTMPRINTAGTVTNIDTDYNAHVTGMTVDWTPGSNDVDFSSSTSFFVNAGNNDFRLAQGVPAIDIGTNLVGFNNDANNVLRPQDAAWDVGAYEFVSAVPIVYKRHKRK